VANNQGTATYNFSGGTINLHNWFAIGRGNLAANGVFNMTGGTFNKDGNGNFLVGTGGSGVLNQSAGTINCQNQFQIPEHGNGTGTYNMSGTAVLTVNDWLAVGRNGGTGTLNLTNGTITKTGGGNIVIGGNGIGTFNQFGGAVTNTGSQTWIGEGGTGTWNLNGGANVFNVVHICQNASSVGTFNVNGGSVTLFELTTGDIGGFSTLNLNGGTIMAANNNVNFLHDLTLAQVGAGGAVFDSQGFNVTIVQSLFDNGGGGLTKNGAGMLTLSGANSYTGGTFVNAGKLTVTTSSSGGGAYAVANGASLRVKPQSLNGQLGMASLTMTGPATSLEFDLDSFGNPSAAPANVTGTFAVNGTVTVNILDSVPQVGQLPLSSTPAARVPVISCLAAFRRACRPT